MKRLALIASVALMAVSCRDTTITGVAPVVTNAYFDNTGRDDVLTGGVTMIPITTPKGTFHVWTKRTGNRPTMKVLWLHGGPGATHEYMEAFDS